MIIIMGMPGAGKTEQGILAQKNLGLHWVSTGQLFRETDDPEIRAVMESGALVEDDMTFRLVENKLKDIGYDETFLLDGFPRSVAQAEWLTEHGDDINKHVSLILFMDVDPEIAAERLGSRGRLDDTNQEVLNKRKEEAKKLEPMIEYYTKEKGVQLVTIDANGTIEEIHEDIKHAVADYLDSDE